MEKPSHRLKPYRSSTLPRECTPVIPSRKGVALLFLAFATGFIYIVNGYSFFLAFSLLALSLLSSSYVLASRGCPGGSFSIEFQFPRRVEAGRQLPVTVKLSRHNRFGSKSRCYLILVDYLPPHYDPSIVVIEKGIGKNTGSTTLEYVVRPRIGSHEFGQTILYSCDPLRLFCTKCKYYVRRRVEASPPLVSSSVQIKTALRIIAGTAAARRRGMGTTFYSIREYVPGDEARLIDWKHSAKTGFNKLYVKELEQESLRNIIVVASFSNKSFICLEGRCPVEETLVVISRVLYTLSQGPEKLGLAIAAPGYYMSTRFSRGRVFQQELVELVSGFEWPDPDMVYGREAGFIPPAIELLVKRRLPVLIPPGVSALLVLAYHVTGFEKPSSMAERIYESVKHLLVRRLGVRIILVYGMPDRILDSVSEKTALLLAEELAAKGLPVTVTSLDGFGTYLSKLL